jgi:hypothetical protein
MPACSTTKEARTESEVSSDKERQEAFALGRRGEYRAGKKLF